MRKESRLGRRFARIQAQHLIHLEMVRNLLIDLLREDPNLTYLEVQKINETCGWDLGEVIYEGLDDYEEDPYYVPTRIEAFHPAPDEMREIWVSLRGSEGNAR